MGLTFSSFGCPLVPSKKCPCNKVTFLDLYSRSVQGTTMKGAFGEAVPKIKLIREFRSHCSVRERCGRKVAEILAAVSSTATANASASRVSHTFAYDRGDSFSICQSAASSTLIAEISVLLVPGVICIFHIRLCTIKRCGRRDL
ncbi:hypothetical protein K440DRAFT_312905 [Wilcoxina mikolae CBS 423.85]|nr:hypothetical protein K440DRAFT_312905 [Wilcoxina mikolae CBS 423.85]